MKIEYTERVTVGEAAHMLRVTPQTVRRWRDAGKLTAFRTPGGQTLYSKEEILNIIGQPMRAEEKGTAHYARSSDGNKKLMESQLEKLKDKYGEADYEIKDSASGLNENRRGLNRLIKLAREGKIDTIRVTQKDRLSRFGNRYLEELFDSYGVKVVYAFDENDKSLTEELMQDFMSLVASFTGKYYRLRGYEEQKKLLRTAERNIEEKKRKRYGDDN